jgi:hypothetical protein
MGPPGVVTGFPCEIIEQRCRADGSIIWLFNDEFFNFGTYIVIEIQDCGE